MNNNHDAGTMSEVALLDQNAVKFVEQQKGLAWPLMPRHRGEKSSWDQTKWWHKGESQSLRFTRHDAPKNLSDKKVDEYALPDSIIDFAKAYMRDLIAQRTKLPLLPSIFQNDITNVKIVAHAMDKLGLPVRISSFTEDVYEECLAFIEDHFGTDNTKVNTTSRLNKFVEWLNDHTGENRLIRRVIHTRQPFSLASSEDKGTVNRKQKHRGIDNMEAVLAHADIVSRILPEMDEIEAMTSSTIWDGVRDRYIASMMTLLLAAPDRYSELFVLEKNCLEVTDGVTYIRFRGSKGHPDFMKPILEDRLTPFVERAVAYLNRVSEPARVLAKYYEAPSTPLKDLLKGTKTLFVPAALDKHKPVTLFELAGVLGVYDVVPTGKAIQKGFMHCRELGWPYGVLPETMVPAIAGAYALGLTTTNNTGLTGKRSLQNIELHWKNHLRLDHKMNPLVRSHKNMKSVPIKDALIAFVGSQLGSKNGAIVGWGNDTPLALESVDVRDGFARMLSGGPKHESIASRYGMPQYTMSTHVARHYLNTILQEAGASQAFIAKLSGRLSVAQNETYDHRSEEGRVADVSMALEDEVVVVPTTEAEMQAKYDLKGLFQKRKTADGTEMVRARTVHRMEVGFCFQPLNLIPCEHANLGCIGCSKNCHVKGDQDDLAIIREDLDEQKAILESAQKRMDNGEPYADLWVEKSRHAYLRLYALVAMLTHPEIEDGALIRFQSEDSMEMVLAKPDMSQVIKCSPLLPDLSDKEGSSNLPAVAKVEPVEEFDAVNDILEMMGI